MASELDFIHGRHGESLHVEVDEVFRSGARAPVLGPVGLTRSSAPTLLHLWLREVVFLAHGLRRDEDYRVFLVEDGVVGVARRSVLLTVFPWPSSPFLRGSPRQPGQGQP